MSWLLRILWFWFTQRAEGQLIDHAKSQGIAAYLRVLQGSRRLIILAVVSFCVLQLAIFAMAGGIISLVFLSEYDLHVKLEILLGISAFFFLIPLIVFVVMTSERVWYKLSGADRMMEELLEPSQNQEPQHK